VLKIPTLDSSLLELWKAQQWVTPTAAALIAELGEMPEMTLENIELGAGKRLDSPDGGPNILRCIIGQLRAQSPTVRVLECNIDDQSPEQLTHVRTRSPEEKPLWTSSDWPLRKGSETLILQRPTHLDYAFTIAQDLFLSAKAIGSRHNLERQGKGSPRSQAHMVYQRRPPTASSPSKGS
jgi:uncharacterized protein (DUF111 family)